MAHALTVYSPSNYGSVEPSAIRSYYNKLMSVGQTYNFDEREGVVHTAIESGATGAVLGAVHAKLAHGLDVNKIPVDGVLGMIGLLVAKGIHGKVGRSVHAVADRSLAIYAFRSTAKLMSAKSKISGEFGADEDPLDAAARDL